MIHYAVRRVAQMGMVLVGTSLILFVCLFVVPGDPIEALSGGGPRIDDATHARLAERYHLDESLPEQYLHWASRLARGDLGESYRLRRPVTSILGEKAGNSLDLAVAAFACEALIGIAAGVMAAASRRSFLDVAVYLGTTLAIGIPTFVIGFGLQQTFALHLHWLPLHGRADGPRSLVLPALTLAAVQAALVARLLRATLREELRADYIRTAHAKGLSRGVVVMKHALRNSIVPAVTYLGVTTGELIGGAAIVEIIFNWDGLGRALVTAIGVQDNPVVLGVVLYSVVAFVVVNLVVDLAYAALDPRVRLAAGAS